MNPHLQLFVNCLERGRPHNDTAKHHSSGGEESIYKVMYGSREGNMKNIVSDEMLLRGKRDGLSSEERGRRA